MEDVSAKAFNDLDIVNKLGAGQFRAAANGVLQQVNDQLGHILGYPSPEALQAATSLTRLFVQVSDYESWQDSLLEEAHQRFATRWIQKNGRIISIDIYGHANFSESGELLSIEGLVFPSKLYETKNLDSRKAISRLMKQNREFMALYDVGQSLASTLDIDEIYQIMYEKIARDLLDAAHLTIALYDEDTEMITCGFVIADGEVLDPNQFPPLPLGEGPVSDTIRSREARIVDLRSLLPNLEEKGRAVTIGDERHAQSSLFVPLMSHDQLLGVMHVLHYEPDAFREADLTLLSILANQASLAITNARLFAQVQEQTDALAAHVAELEKAESALRTSELRYRTIVESAPEAIVVLNAEDGRFDIVEANRSAGELIGVTTDALLGSELPQYFPEHQTNGRSSGPFFTERVKQALAGRPSVFEWELLNEDGSIVPCEISLSRFPTTNHKLVRGMIRDITERKRTEEMLRQVQKIDSLGMLAGGVAHDFNNLLVAMMGQASLALAKLPPDSPVRSAIEKALLAAERASELTQQLLAYSGGGRFEFGSLNLNQLVQDNLHLFEVVVPKNVTLQAHLGENVPLIRGDKSQLQQVVMNLIINATEAMDKQEGEVAVRTAVTHIGPDDDWAWQYTGEFLPPNTYVMLEVADNGSGIPDSVLQKIFDPFFTTKFTGRGLGLAAVLGIVKTHEGGLAIQTEIGEGTTFQLLFPATDQVKKEEGPSPAPAPAETYEGCVLVIDDEEPVREAVQDILELENIITITAANGEEGLSLYRQHHDAIKLVLLDLSMPGMSGEETLTGLHKIDPGVKVVLSSGYSQGDALKQMPVDRLAGFLQKPYRTEQLIDVVQEHLRV